jgi:hypothetical protein
VRNRNTWKLGAMLASLLMLHGCASRVPVAAECPRFVPSPEALTPIRGTGWKPLAERVIETYSKPSSEP